MSTIIPSDAAYCLANEAAHQACNESKIGIASVQPPSLIQKTAKIATIVFKAIVSFFLYWTNPSLFCLGFLIGIVGDEQSRKGIEKIKNVWNTQPWSMCIMGVFACVLSLPVTIGSSSCIWGAYLGSSLSQQTQKIINQRNQKDIPVASPPSVVVPLVVETIHSL